MCSNLAGAYLACKSAGILRYKAHHPFCYEMIGREYGYMLCKKGLPREKDIINLKFFRIMSLL